MPVISIVMPSIGYLTAGLSLLYILIPLNRFCRYVGAAMLAGVFYFLIWPITYTNYRLEQGGRSAVGIVINKDCSVRKHQVIEYRFKAGNKEYRGKGIPRNGNQPCDAFRVGDQVYVTYLGADPNVSLPQRTVRSIPFFGIFLALFIFAVLVRLNYERTRFRKSKLERERGAA